LCQFNVFFDPAPATSDEANPFSLPTDNSPGFRDCMHVTTVHPKTVCSIKRKE
jgi:hypothetical protein